MKINAFVFIIIVIWFGAVGIFNLFLHGITESILFKDEEIIITKRKNKVSHLRIISLKICHVKIKGWWKGIVLKNNDSNMITIWKHEFSDSNWDLLTKKLNEIATFGEDKSDWSGLKYSGK